MKKMLPTLVLFLLVVSCQKHSPGAPLTYHFTCDIDGVHKDLSRFISARRITMMDVTTIYITALDSTAHDKFQLTLSTGPIPPSLRTYADSSTDCSLEGLYSPFVPNQQYVMSPRILSEAIQGNIPVTDHFSLTLKLSTDSTLGGKFSGDLFDDVYPLTPRKVHVSSGDFYIPVRNY